MDRTADSWRTAESSQHTSYYGAGRAAPSPAAGFGLNSTLGAASGDGGAAVSCTADRCRAMPRAGRAKQGRGGAGREGHAGEGGEEDRAGGRDEARGRREMEVKQGSTRGSSNSLLLPHPTSGAGTGGSIHTEAARGQVDAVARLLATGVPVEQRDAFGDTALVKAARRGATEVVRLLLDQRADPNTQNDDGYTALMLAVYWDQPAAAELLLRAGADVTLASNTGRTAADTARHETCRALLGRAAELRAAGLPRPYGGGRLGSPPRTGTSQRQASGQLGWASAAWSPPQPSRSFALSESLAAPAHQSGSSSFVGGLVSAARPSMLDTSRPSLLESTFGAVGVGGGGGSLANELMALLAADESAYGVAGAEPRAASAAGSWLPELRMLKAQLAAGTLSRPAYEQRKAGLLGRLRYLPAGAAGISALQVMQLLQSPAAQPSDRAVLGSFRQ